jgi:hypothetical protein
MKRYILTTTLLITALVTVISPIAGAVTSAGQPTNSTGQALEIAPPYLNLKANPGETIQTKIALRDISASSLYVTNEVNDFTANGEDGTPKVIINSGEKSPYSIIDWIQPIAPLTLKSRQIENVPVTINVPANAAPGGYYGVVRFTATPPDIEQSGVSLSASLGAMIFIRVNGDAKESINIQDFYPSKDGAKGWLFDSAPVTFTARVKNDGTVHEQPVGQIIIKDIFGKVAVAVNMNLETRNVLPGTVRRFDAVMDSRAIGDRVLFGPYTATLTMKYGASDQTVTKTTSFWIFPWKLLLTAIVVLIILVLIARMLIKRYNDRLLGSRGGRSRRR